MFTKEEVAKHNTEHDCWLIIDNKVYDVSDYVDVHPGGPAILNNAGGDSSKGTRTNFISIPSAHSGRISW